MIIGEYMEKIRSHYSLDVTSEEYGKTISVAGWVEDVRNLGSLAGYLFEEKEC